MQTGHTTTTLSIWNAATDGQGFTLHTTRGLQPVLMEHLNNSLNPSTSRGYQQIFNEFCLFLDRQFIVPMKIPASMTTIALYISHPCQLRCQYSTIRSCVSAISFVNKPAGYEDPTTSFLVTN